MSNHPQGNKSFENWSVEIAKAAQVKKKTALVGIIIL